jgi:hypothetical protein
MIGMHKMCFNPYGMPFGEKKYFKSWHMKFLICLNIYNHNLKFEIIFKA